MFNLTLPIISSRHVALHYYVMSVTIEVTLFDLVFVFVRFTFLPWLYTPSIVVHLSSRNCCLSFQQTLRVARDLSLYSALLTFCPCAFMFLLRNKSSVCSDIHVSLGHVCAINLLSTICYRDFVLFPI